MKNTDVSIKIAEIIRPQLKAGQTVLFFVSGGSTIQQAVGARNLLNPSMLSGDLHILLVDERMGSVGHKDSNWQKLTEAHFNFENTLPHSILNGNSDPEIISKEYNKLVKNLKKDSTFSIGLFGIGEDGHTAGLLPFNPLMNLLDFYGYYQAPDFQRISMTPTLIKQLDCAILSGYGENKAKALKKFLEPGEADEIPAKLLKGVPNFILFTDNN